MNKYEHQKVEKKWQEKWKESGLYKTDFKDSTKEKYYLLDMWPYPSGDGLHMGHVEGYGVTDTLYRYKKMKGFNVLHPQGFDAFGLPAENYAITTGTHPSETTKVNSENYLRQWENLGMGHDFSKITEQTTSNPEYYKWTQLLFGKFFENDIAYKKTAKANWCESCKTVIATEQMENGNCERCGTSIEQKEIPSWMFRITDFADDLIWNETNKNIDWPEHTKKNQNNWIGKSTGAHIDFDIVESEYSDVNRDGGADSYQDGVEEIERFNVVVVVENLDGSEFLCAKWKKSDWQGFVTGGIENGDTATQTAIKEVQEETGYQNVEIVKIYNQSSHGKFYHVGKKVNRFAHYQIVHVKLTDLEKIERSEEEKEIADMVWIEKAKVNDFLKREDMKYPWRVVNGEDGLSKKIKVFTTRPDTLFGATYTVLAPEHKLVESLKERIFNWSEVEKYISDTKKKTELERLENKEKTGVELKGVSAKNPANGELVPIFISDYVLAGYGTGAIMAVPAHDERDNEFAKKFGIEIRESIAGNFILKDELAPKEDVETLNRRCVDVIMENCKGEFLMQKDTHWHFVGGGVEDGDSLKDTVIKEIKEETGYVNLKIEKLFLNNTFAFHYRETKNKNQKTNSAVFHVKLLNEEKIKSEVEEGKHIIEWVKKEDVSKKMEWVHHQFEWDVFNGEIFSGNGVLVNSGKFTGMDSAEAKEKITEFVGGEMTSTYRLRDWSISRQRYWGTPIPIVYSPEGVATFVGEENLPWLLPTDVDFVPTGTAPLLQSKELFKRTEDIFGKGWTPEVDTMDTFVDSSWYFLRYCDPENTKEFASADAIKKWMPVDLYIGGAEHTYMHLLFARFFVKAMKKIGTVDFDEPFLKLRHQGMVNDLSGKKMSKSKGNVVNPDEMVKRFGADATRTYMLFSSPLEDDVMWNEDNIVGVYRFLEKVWRQTEKLSNENNDEIKKELHKTIKSVTEKIEGLRFNVAISDMMKFINLCDKQKSINSDDFSDFIKLLSPFAPHIADELSGEFQIEKNWPVFDTELAKDETITMGIQVNGKRRAEIELSIDIKEDEVKERVLSMDEVQKWTEGKEIKKFIYVKGRIISVIV
jgi:leucyl-tRNA synthetase